MTASAFVGNLWASRICTRIHSWSVGRRRRWLSVLMHVRVLHRKFLSSWVLCNRARNGNRRGRHDGSPRTTVRCVRLSPRSAGAQGGGQRQGRREERQRWCPVEKRTRQNLLNVHTVRGDACLLFRRGNAVTRVATSQTRSRTRGATMYDSVGNAKRFAIGCKHCENYTNDVIVTIM